MLINDFESLDNPVNDQIKSFLNQRMTCSNRQGVMASPCKQSVRACIKSYLKSQRVKIGSEYDFLLECKNCKKGNEYYQKWLQLRLPLKKC